MMISSSAVLLYLSLCVSLDVLLLLFGVYVVWSSIVLLIFSFLRSHYLFSFAKKWVVFGFCVLVYATPVSVAVIYKLFIAWSMLSSGIVAVIL